VFVRQRRPPLDGPLPALHLLDRARGFARSWSGVGERDVLDTTAEVETPEQVRFRYRVAGPARRAAAYLIDLAIRLAILVVLATVVALAFGITGRSEGSDGPQASQGVILVIMFVLEWGYYVAFETAWSGRTPGKRALGIRVMKEGGYPLNFVDSVLRNLLRAADFLPAGYAAGLLVMAGDRRFRRLGDRVAGTMVVMEERAALPAPLVLSPPPSPSELEPLPQRPRLTGDERESLELFLRRSDLGPARRQELADMIAPALARRLGVPPGDPVRLLALVHHRAQAANRSAPPAGPPSARPGTP
jgi:uncharacterized RDD family membrane protein YckC